MILLSHPCLGASLVAQMVKNLPAMQETQVQSLGQEDLTWRRQGQPTPVFLPGESPWMEEPSGLQYMWLQSRTRLRNEAQHSIAHYYIWGFPGGSNCTESACSAGDPVPSLGQEDPLEKGMATHCSILAWRIPWTGEPGRLQSMGLQSVGHD